MKTRITFSTLAHPEGFPERLYRSPFMSIEVEGARTNQEAIEIARNYFMAERPADFSKERWAEAFPIVSINGYPPVGTPL